MKTLTIALIAASLALAITGCAAPVAKMTSTASGKPEVTIRASVDEIKSELLSRAINRGLSLEQDTPHQMTFSRPATGGANLMIAMAIGNSYSTNHGITSYTFVKTGDSVRVIGSASARAQMPGGQVNTMDLNDNGEAYNAIQKGLLDVKRAVEASGT